MKDLKETLTAFNNEQAERELLREQLESIHSAEMYSNSNLKKNRNKNKNMFQQSTDLAGPTDENLRSQATILFPSPSAPVKKDQGIPGDQESVYEEPKYGRRLNWQKDKIVEMRLQIGDFRIGKRYQRARAYLSIKTEDDKRFMIFMRSSLTTAIDETFRSIRKSNDKVLETVATDVYHEHGMNLLFMGRVKYKVVRGQKITKYHRQNLPLALLSMWTDNDNNQCARLHLLGDDYDFILSNEISEKQKKFYNFEGTWEDDTSTLTLDEAFGG